MDFINETADELRETFAFGNRKDTLARLEELPVRVAFAVLATIIDANGSVARWLRESA